MKALRRGVTAMITVTMACASLAACGAGGDSGEKGAVSYGGQTIVPDLVFRAKNWGKPHDVSIKQVRFPSGSEAFEALLSGEVNISNGGSGRLITIAAQRPDSVRIVSKWQYGGDRYSVVVPPGSSLNSAQDLVGKKVAVDTGSGAYTLFVNWLRINNVSPDDVTIVQTKITDVGAALQSKSADVGVAWEPTASLLVYKKLVERMTTLKEAGESPNFLIVNKKWAESHRTELINFLKAAGDVGDLITDDPQTAGDLAADVNQKEGVDTPAAALAESLTHVEMQPAVDRASLDELTDLAEQLMKDKKIPNVPKFADLVDDSYLKDAMGQ